MRPSHPDATRTRGAVDSSRAWASQVRCRMPSTSHMGRSSVSASCEAGIEQQPEVGMKHVNHRGMHAAGGDDTLNGW